MVGVVDVDEEDGGGMGYERKLVLLFYWLLRVVSLFFLSICDWMRNCIFVGFLMLNFVLCFGMMLIVRCVYF